MHGRANHNFFPITFLDAYKYADFQRNHWLSDEQLFGVSLWMLYYRVFDVFIWRTETHNRLRTVPDVCVRLMCTHSSQILSGLLLLPA